MTNGATLKLTLGAAILVSWEALRRFDLVSPLLLASPSEIAAAALNAGPPLWTAFRTTLLEILAAVALSWTFGLTVGLLVGSNRCAQSVFAPIFSSAFSVPKIIFYPLMLVWLGIGPSSKIAFAVFTSFFTIALTTMESIAAMDLRYIALVRSFGASKPRLFVSVCLPLALPGIISGLRIGAALAVISVIVAEMLASFNGLGFWISSSRSNFETDNVYLGIALALAFSISINVLLTKLETRFSKWRVSERNRFGHDESQIDAVPF